MSDNHVKVQLEQMKSLGESGERLEGVDNEEQVPLSSPSADPPSITISTSDVSNTSNTSKQRGKSRRKDDKNSSGKSITDLSLHGSVVSAPTGKNLNRQSQERTLHIKGSGKSLQGKTENNGNYVTIHPSKNIQEARREEALKLARKRRPVTVDTAKAKTSLEAMKISIKQLKWKEVQHISSVFTLCLIEMQLTPAWFSKQRWGASSRDHP